MQTALTKKSQPKKETIEEFLARGGKIDRVPRSATAGTLSVRAEHSIALGGQKRERGQRGRP